MESGNVLQKSESWRAPWMMHEFFAGSGLVAYGLKGMFHPVWANDISISKARVYQANIPCGFFRLGDIKKEYGGILPYAHLSWASFPCQDLSLAGSLKGIYASRSGLVWEWLRILDEMKHQPAILLIENVSGLLSARGGEHYKSLHYALVDRGFSCGAMVLNAARFLPQSRPRVFILAVKKGCPVPRELTGHAPCWLHNRAARTLGEILPDWIWWKTAEPEERSISLEDVIEKTAPFDKDEVLRLIPESHQKRLDNYDSFYTTGYRRMRNGQQCLELRFDGIAGCLRTPEGGSSKQFLIARQHGKTHARLLTVREAARLMGAPDNYQLPGSCCDGYKAMGDAVAVPVARFLGERFLIKIAEAVYHERPNGTAESISGRKPYPNQGAAVPHGAIYTHDTKQAVSSASA